MALIRPGLALNGIRASEVSVPERGFVALIPIQAFAVHQAEEPNQDSFSPRAGIRGFDTCAAFYNDDTNR